MEGKSRGLRAGISVACGLLAALICGKAAATDEEVMLRVRIPWGAEPRTVTHFPVQAFLTVGAESERRSDDALIPDVAHSWVLDLTRCLEAVDHWRQVSGSDGAKEGSGLGLKLAAGAVVVIGALLVVRNQVFDDVAKNSLNRDADKDSTNNEPPSSGSPLPSL